ncbi:hypothetical protein IT412_05550 [Candidatus Peregrinibacteria bacterium]|nr:hypothetical protein [Candidatus Peregrinibacteria bacterium]
MTKTNFFRKIRLNNSRKAFTLPEVIVSFSVLIMVITSAAGILASVIRSNGDNVNSLVAYGLAQEGVEAVRFVRDSNFTLGLDFDGVTKSLSAAPFGAKLFDGVNPKVFKVVLNDTVAPSCTKDVLANCLPIKLAELSGDFESLQAGEEGRMMIKESESGEIEYLQVDGLVSEMNPSIYKRLVRVEQIEPGKLRVSVWVGWNSLTSNLPKQVMITTDLTDWRS